MDLNCMSWYSGVCPNYTSPDIVQKIPNSIEWDSTKYVLLNVNTVQSIFFMYFKSV